MITQINIYRKQNTELRKELIFRKQQQQKSKKYRRIENKRQKEIQKKKELTIIKNKLLLEEIKNIKQRINSQEKKKRFLLQNTINLLEEIHTPGTNNHIYKSIETLEEINKYVFEKLRNRE